MYHKKGQCIKATAHYTTWLNDSPALDLKYIFSARCFISDPKSVSRATESHVVCGSLPVRLVIKYVCLAFTFSDTSTKS